MADTVVQELVINTLTQAQFDAAKEAGTLSPYELYGTPDTSVRLPILMSIWSDHLLNDISWLRADTFSWQSGNVYIAAYEHLLSDFENRSGEMFYAWRSDQYGYYLYTTTTTPDSTTVFYDEDFQVDTEHTFSYFDGGILYLDDRPEPEISFQRDPSKDTIAPSVDTVGDITITYYLAEDGHKICLPDQEDKVLALYNATGVAWYYILDTANKQFKLPRKQKRTLIQAVKNTDGTWYNLYSDGWVEQGGRGQTNVSVSLPVAMADSNYVVLVENHVRVNGGTGASDMTTTSFIPRWQQHNANAWGSGNFAVSWQVSGYAAESAYASAGMRLEYYYVGNFTQEAIEQTAGLNAELFNGKADVSRVEVLEGYDYVVESQMPTASNGYTWYRKYKSGWVEQGGRCTVPATNAYSSSSVTITLPVPIQTPEAAVLSYSGLNASENFANCENQAALSATTATIGRWNNGNATAAARSYMWVLYGQSQ